MVLCRHLACNVPPLLAPLTHKNLISGSLRRSVARDGQLLCLHQGRPRRNAHAAASIASGPAEPFSTADGQRACRKCLAADGVSCMWADHARYIDEVAVSTRPERLETLLQVGEQRAPVYHGHMSLRMQQHQLWGCVAGPRGAGADPSLSGRQAGAAPLVDTLGSAAIFAAKWRRQSERQWRTQRRATHMHPSVAGPNVKSGGCCVAMGLPCPCVCGVNQ